MGSKVEPIGPCPRLREGSPRVAFGGHANAFERFAVSQVLRLGSGRRLPRGLRRPCHGLPLVRRADPGKKPGGIRVRPLSRADRTALGPTGRSSGSLGTSIASRIEAGGVNQSQVSGTGGHGGDPLRTAVARRTPADEDHRHEAGGHRDRPLGATVARRTPTDGNRGDKTGAGPHGDRPLGASVAGRI